MRYNTVNILQVLHSRFVPSTPTSRRRSAAPYERGAVLGGYVVECGAGDEAAFYRLLIFKAPSSAFFSWKVGRTKEYLTTGCLLDMQICA